MKQIDELPLISVIVPIYNVEKYLCRCVDSIINQSYRNLEIILVDDGSPDKCGEICDEYAKKDSRIVVIHKKNGGLSDARNFGLDVARGKYVMFVDSDDWVHLEIVERLYGGLVSNNAQIAIADFLKVYDEKAEIENELGGKIEVYDRDSFLNDFYWTKSSMCVIACAKLFEKSLFDNDKFPLGKIHEDAYTIPWIYVKVNKVLVLFDKLYFYFQRENSIMNSTSFLLHEENVKAVSCYMDYFLEKGYIDSYAKGVPILLELISKEYAFLLNIIKDKKKTKEYSLLARKYLKLSKKIGKKYYSLTIKTSPHIYEAAYPRFMRFYWLWCSLKNKFKK